MFSVHTAVSLAGVIVSTHAYRGFRNTMPNGYNVRDCNGAVVPGVGHLREAGGGARNGFGEQFHEQYTGVWDEYICRLDSDGDGRTNGEELGDPNCVWTPGQTPEITEGITHPGLACGPSPAPPQVIQMIGWGGHIEGASVDPWGNLYATHFRNTADNSSSGNNVGKDVIGRLPRGAASGGEAWFSILPPEPDAQYNGMKWDSEGSIVYVADVGQGKVMKLDSGYADLGYRGWEVHCSDPWWKLQGMPNDLALSDSGLLFLSGQDWASSTGAIWLCRPDGEVVLLEPQMGRTNGIALSPDSTTLYVTEARGSPVADSSQSDGQRIWKYAVASDGSISQKTLFFNFATDTNSPEAETDSDGMRTDVAGNLYVTRNGLGKVAVITPQGTLSRDIPLTKTNFPSNLAFSPSGDLLYVVGRCGNAGWSTGDGCVEVVPISVTTPAPTPPVPTPAPTTPEPTPAPTTPEPTPAPTTTPEPTPAPTPPPTPAPTTTQAPAPSCCKWSSSCGGSCATGWCSNSAADCQGCGGTWCAPSALSSGPSSLHRATKHKYGLLR